MYSIRIDPSVSSYISSNIYGSVLRAFLFVRDMGTSATRRIQHQAGYAAHAQGVLAQRARCLQQGVGHPQHLDPILASSSVDYSHYRYIIYEFYTAVRYLLCLL